jgi:amino acid adenylation domain-containing protein
MGKETLRDMFTLTCITNATKPAIVAENVEYTYLQFMNDVEKLTNHLKAIKREYGYANIAVYKRRDYKLLVSLWAIIKAGAIYIPIDVGLNQKRVQYFLENSRANIIITDDKYIEKVESISKECFVLNLSDEHGGDHISAMEVQKPEQMSEEFSYIIYTSGTTGHPKGIQITEEALLSFICNFSEILPGDSYSKIIAHTSISFDISMVEIVYSIVKGKTVILCNDDEHANVRSVLRLISEYNVDCLQLTPSLLALMLEMVEYKKLENLKYLLVGGEKFPDYILKRVKQLLKCEIKNLYGPTEATVWCMCQQQNNVDEICIGHTFGDNKIFLLNHDNEMIDAEGIEGEICISGSQLAKCYYRYPALTEEKFVNDLNIYPNRFYRTGDQAYYDKSGRMVYLRRKDNQIKLNGKRIEIEDIERMILDYDGVSDNIVFCLDQGRKKILRCYYKPNKEFSKLELKSYLKENIPQYMIPKEFYKIDHIPLNNNGKKDRNITNEAYYINE